MSAAIEKCKWNTDPDNADTGGDGLGDCTEAHDVNGNGLANVADATFVRRAAFGLDDGDLAAENMNGNGVVNVADAMLILRGYFRIDACR